MITISIDATWLGKSKTGTAVYLLEILNCWNKNKSINNQFIIFRAKDSAFHFDQLNLDMRFVFIESPLDRRIRIFWQQLVIPFFLIKMNVSVHWGAGFVLPFMKICPMVVTIYDLTYQKFPETHEPIKRFYFPYMIERAIKKAESIITISNSTRNDLMNLYPNSKSKIDVTFLAARHINSNSQVKKDKLLFNLTPKSYFLFVGTIEPRKNLTRLLQAWSELTLEQRGNLSLVVVGLKGWMVDDLIKSMDDGLEKNINYLNYVSDSDLQILIQEAIALVYPSIYEGFGLPVLEAMSLGTPVITSNIGATQEIANGVAVLVDPMSVSSIKNGLLQMMDANLRENLKEIGLRRSGMFSWDNTAKETLLILERAAS